MKRILLFLAVLLLLIFKAQGEGMGVYRLVDSYGAPLTEVAEEPDIGDEYISSENRLYRIIEVKGDRAIAEYVGEVELPDVSWLSAEDAVSVTALTRRIDLYCTHSDESYEPSDGYYSSDKRGSIYEVAQALAQALNEEGAEAIASDALHHPHDAGAYRRSRQTAIDLMKRGLPDCILDIHRDGIPDPAAYAVTIGGQEASKVRLLVGRGNQNMEVNREFALLVKAVADQVYPGLIKDIYMGRGTFNQDLLPRALLLECGTYTLEKERVLRAMPMMADVLTRALYGGVTGSAGRTVSDSRGPAASGEEDIVPGATDMPVPETTKGSGKGILLVIGVGALGLVGYALLSAGSLKGGMRKAGRNLNEMTGGLLGTKPGEDEDPRHS